MTWTFGSPSNDAPSSTPGWSFGSPPPDDTLQQAQAVTAANASTPPETAASAASLAPKVGLPQAVVETDVPRFQQQAQSQKNSALLNQNPVLASWVAANPDSARVAQSEYDKLSAIEKLWGGIKNAGYATAQGLGGSFNELELGLDRLAVGATNVFSSDAASWLYAHSVAHKLQDRPVFQPDQDSFSAKALAGAGSMLGQMSQIVLTGGAGEAGAAETAIQGAMNALGHAGRAMMLPSLTAAVNTGQDVYDQTGNRGQAAAAAAVAYGFTTLQGAVPLSAPGGLLKRLATGGVYGSVEGEAQRLAMNAVLPEHMRHAFDPSELVLNAVTSAIMGGVLGPRVEPEMQAAIRWTYSQQADALRAADAMGRIQGLSSAVEGSKLKESAPGALQRFVEMVTDGSPLEAVYVHPDKLGEAFAQSGVEPTPDLAQRIRDAQASSTDVRLPMTDYVSQVSGTPTEKTLLPEMRVSPDGMTFGEAEQHLSKATEEMQTKADQMAKLREQRTALEADKATVHQNIFDQLQATGRNPEAVNKAYATLISEHYAALASREGVKPSELYKKLPLTIATEGQGLAQPAFHGSPHIFDKFSTEKMGTGEGAQAYGWGMYFGGNRAVAEQYRKALSTARVTLDGKPFDLFKHAGDMNERVALSEVELRGSVDKALASMREDADAIRQRHPSIAKEKDAEVAWLEANRDRVKHEEGGALYHVDIPGDESMLHWDKPLSEQPEAARKALEKLDPDTYRPDGGDYDANETGQMTYERLASTLGQEGASRKLHELGVDGIKYLDGGSRAAGEGSHNYVVFNDEAVKILDRYYQEGQRGAFNPEARTMAIMQHGDLTTVLHESGHLFLDNLERLATSGSESAKADMDLLLKHFGEKGDTPEERLANWNARSLDEKRASHESFAEGFERYLMEGVAPSEHLRTLFGRFRSWLLNVYQKLRGNEIDPEVRGVMDRMLATDQAIKEAEAQRGYAPLFEDAKAMGVDSEEFNKYVELGRQATEAAVSKLQSQSLKDMKWVSGAKSKALKALQRQAIAARREVRGQVENDVAKHPAFQAQDFLRQHAEDRAGRTDLNMVAAMHGFDDEKAMRQAILEAGNREDVIKAETDRRMLQEHGELTDPQAMEDAANAAVHNEARARFMATGLKALMKSPLSATGLAKAAKAVAEKMIAGTRIGELRTDIYRAAEARANREALEAAAKKPGEAIEAQRAALLNNRLAKAAQDAQTEIAKGLKFLRRFDKPTAELGKAVGADYLDRINEILSRYDISPRYNTIEAQSQRLELRDWVAKEFERTGVAPQISDAVLDFATKRHWKELSVEEFRGVLDAVKSLDHVGREQTTVEIAGKKMALDALVEEAKASTADLPHSDPTDIQPHLLHATGLNLINAKWLALKSKVRGLDAALLKMEQMLQWLQHGGHAGLGSHISGPWLRMFQRASHAEGQERLMRAQSVKDLRSIKEGLEGVNIHESLNIPELPRKGRGGQWYREELISAALNTGNESNLTKLTKGYGWDRQILEAALDKHLSTAEWNFVQGAWNAVGRYGEAIRDLQRRQTGITPEMIQGRQIKNSHGTFDGGYYPVVYDAFLDRSIDLKKQKETASLFENQFSQPTTSKGHTMERTGYVGPLHLSLGVIARHLDQVTHDLAWREAIVDMNKFFSHKGIQGEVDQVMGREYTKQFRPWLQAMANDKVFNTAGDSAWENFYRKVRTNATLVGLGFRLSTMMIHGASALSNSIGEIGGKYMAKGAAQFATPERFEAAKAFMYERSPEMANRFNEWDRNIHEGIDEINARQRSMGPISATQKVADNARKFAFYGISMLDMASAAPTWYGAYLKGMSKTADGGHGMSEEDAVDYANRAVRNAHGGGGTKDLSAVQRDKGVMSMATLFYSYWSHMYNRQRDLFKGYANLPDSFRNGTGTKDFPKLLARSAFYFIVPQLIHAMLKPAPQGQEPEDEGKHIAGELALGFVSGVPVLRDLASAVFNGRDYTITPLEEAGKAIVKATEDTVKFAQGEPTSSHAGKNLAQAAGYAFGLPTGQLSATGTFLWDVYNGDAQPQDIKDWYEGVQTGHLSQ